MFFTTSRLPDHPFQHALGDWPPTTSRQPNESSNTIMLQLGIIWSSSSPWCSPLHMVPKKTPGDWRLTTVPSTKTPYLIGIQSHTFTIFFLPTGCYHFLQARSRLSLSPNPHSPCRHCQDCCHHPLRTIRVCENATWTPRCCTNLSKVHGSSPPWYSICVRVH